MSYSLDQRVAERRGRADTALQFGRFQSEAIVRDGDVIGADVASRRPFGVLLSGDLWYDNKVRLMYILMHVDTATLLWITKRLKNNVITYEEPRESGHYALYIYQYTEGRRFKKPKSRSRFDRERYAADHKLHLVDKIMFRVSASLSYRNHVTPTRAPGVRQPERRVYARPRSPRPLEIPRTQTSAELPRLESRGQSRNGGSTVSLDDRPSGAGADAGNYAGDYAGDYADDYAGNYAGEYAGDYAGDHADDHADDLSLDADRRKRLRTEVYPERADAADSVDAAGRAARDEEFSFDLDDDSTAGDFTTSADEEAERLMATAMKYHHLPK